MSKLKVLVTGCAGYIGSRFCQLLSQHYDITGIDNLMYHQGPLVYNALQGVKFYELNVAEYSHEYEKLVANADVVVFLSALVGAPACQNKPELAESYNKTSVIALNDILDKWNWINGPVILYPNTNSGYGSQTSLCTEETPISPLSGYAEQKSFGEKLLLEYNKTIAFRLATVFGLSPRIRTDLLINSLVYEAVSKGHIEVFDGDFIRNYIHVDDIVRAFEFAIENANSMKGQVFNLGNDYLNCSKRQLATFIGAKLNVPVIDDNDRTDGDKRNYIVSSSKLYNLGFAAERNLTDAISELELFYRNLPADAGQREKLLSMMRNA